MSKLRKNGAEAWPIAREAGHHRPILEKVIIESVHPAGHGVVHLTPDQALYVHSRLSHVAMAFLHGHELRVEHFGVDHLPEDHAHRMSRCGAKVWPVNHDGPGRSSVLDEVVVEGDGPAGHGVVHLTPGQARYLHDRLTQITLAFLHENVWGGEDARAQ